MRFNWTWVGLVRGDHEYGRFAVQGLLRELKGTKICVAYQQMIPLLYSRQKALEIIQVDYCPTDFILFKKSIFTHTSNVSVP